jgi:hypothetical protein
MYLRCNVKKRYALSAACEVSRATLEKLCFATTFASYAISIPHTHYRGFDT